MLHSSLYKDSESLEHFPLFVSGFHERYSLSSEASLIKFEQINVIAYWELINAFTAVNYT